MHPGGESLPGDPNAAYCIDGVYHLHYILAHPWKGKRSYSFIHVTSKDMLHWQWQETKLQPSFTEHGMYSGTGLISKEGKPIAVYHGQGSDRNYITVAKNNQLSAWDKPYEIKIKNHDGSEANINIHWDPDCFIIGDTYYAISGGIDQPLFKSKDLVNWVYVGKFMSHDLPDTTIGEDISCPNFFKLGNKWILLCISHPLGCRYYIGDWDHQKEQFVPDYHARMNWKRDEQPLYSSMRRTDFFAPESTLTENGRRVMWAWLTSVGPERKLLNTSLQSLPRELSLSDKNELLIKPLKELEQQRHDMKRLENVLLSEPITDHVVNLPPLKNVKLQHLVEFEGDSNEFRILIPRDDAMRKLFGFVLFAENNEGGMPIIFRPETGCIRLGTTEGPFYINELPNNEDVELRIFIDKYLVEIFVNSKQALLAAYMDYEGKTTLQGFTVGATTKITSIENWKIKATNQGYKEAQNNRIWEPNQE